MKNADMPIATLVATDNLARTMRSEGVEDTIKALGGITKREHFAAMAMQGLLSSGYNLRALQEDVIEKSIEYADELLKALDK